MNFCRSRNFWRLNGQRWVRVSQCRRRQRVRSNNGNTRERHRRRWLRLRRTDSPFRTLGDHIVPTLCPMAILLGPRWLEQRPRRPTLRLLLDMTLTQIALKNWTCSACCSSPRCALAFHAFDKAAQSLVALLRNDALCPCFRFSVRSFAILSFIVPLCRLGDRVAIN